MLIYDKERNAENCQEDRFFRNSFYKKSKTTSFKIEFFTPNKQVAICGHATIAALLEIENKYIKNVFVGGNAQIQKFINI